MIRVHALISLYAQLPYNYFIANMQQIRNPLASLQNASNENSPKKPSANQKEKVE